jgi:glycosyltransferase involved in cell wall biosynthesis
MNSVQVARQQLISRMAANVTLDFIPPDLQAVVRAQRRFATLQSSDIFAKIMTEAQEIEPLVGERLEKREVLVAPFHDGMASQLRALLSKLQRTQYDHIICVPWVRAGGADLVSGFLSHAISELYPDQTILLLLTDNPHLERRDWIAAKVDILDMSEMTHQTAAADAERLLLTLVRGLHPRFVFNVNSRLCWQFMRRFGSRVGDTKLISYLFCWDQTATGVKVGYPSEFFQETQAFLTALLTDTQYLKDELNRTYALPEEVRHRIVPIASPSHSTASGPTMAERGAKSGSARERPLFLWGGRLDLQKRFDLLIKIARRMPDCDFHCWGSAMLDRSPNLADLPSNIQMMGDFKHLTDLPLGACEGWIFTSAWEGMPTTIIELGVLGMPLVASAVGGIPELIDATTGWIVSPFDDVERFVTCLREMIASPEARCVRANELRIRTQKRHNMRAYKAALARVLEGEAA